MTENKLTQITVQMKSSEAAEALIGVTIIGILLQTKEAQEIIDGIIERGSERIGHPIEESRACYDMGERLIEELIRVAGEKALEEIDADESEG